MKFCYFVVEVDDGFMGVGGVFRGVGFLGGVIIVGLFWACCWCLPCFGLSKFARSYFVDICAVQKLLLLGVINPARYGLSMP